MSSHSKQLSLSSPVALQNIYYHMGASNLGTNCWGNLSSSHVGSPFYGLYKTRIEIFHRGCSTEKGGGGRNCRPGI